MSFLAVLALILSLVAGLWSMGRRQREVEARLDRLSAELAEAFEQIGRLRSGASPGDGPRGETARSAGSEPPVGSEAVPPPDSAPEGSKASVPVVRADAPGEVPERVTTPAEMPASLEQRLGTRWAVWVGGLALALGGVLLVRYTIEQGLLGPGARVAAGALLALFLVGLGEWMRRRGFAPSLPGLAAAHVPSVLTAAGTLVAFATAYAAHALYGLLGPGAAFVVLGAIGIATMLAAVLHGPALAALGLAGAYVAPMLVSSSRPSPWPVVTYLAVVGASAMMLSRLRQWLWLAMLAVGGAMLWGALLLDPAHTIDTGWTLAVYTHVLLQLAIGAGFLAIEPHLGVADEAAAIDPVATGALAAVSLLAAATLFDTRFMLPHTVVFAALAIAGFSATAWLSPPAAWAAACAGLVSVAVSAAWPGLQAAASVTQLAPYAAGVLRLPDNVTSFLATAAFLSASAAGVSAVRLWRGPLLDWRPAGALAFGATLPPLAALVIAYLRVAQFDASIPFALIGLVLSLVFAALAERAQRREDVVPLPALRLATGAFASASVAALAFALTAMLSRGYLTVALSLAALGTAWVATVRDIPMLRSVVAGIGAVVLARIVWDPVIAGAGVGRIPVFNWLLIGYGVPAASFTVAATLLLSRGADVAQRLCEALAVAFSFLLVVFQIRHALRDGNPLALGTSHLEQGLDVTVGLLFAYALMRMDLRSASPVLYYGSIAFSGLAVVHALAALIFDRNPLFRYSELVGGPIVFSTLLFGYFVPGVAAAFLARTSRGHRPAWVVNALFALAGVLVFLYVSSETRHVFQGASIEISRRTSGAEHWAYSAAWLALGIVYLGYGLWRRAGIARLASAILVVLAVLKVFLFDLAGLSGPWRALSFITLGAVLIGIGLVYQRLLASSLSSAPKT